jgi:hypothetical protein
MEAELKAVVMEAGFVDFEITWRDDVFKGAPQQSSAAQFGTLGRNFRARKPSNQCRSDEQIRHSQLNQVHTHHIINNHRAFPQPRALNEIFPSTISLACNIASKVPFLA